MRQNHRGCKKGMLSLVLVLVLSPWLGQSLAAQAAPAGEQVLPGMTNENVVLWLRCAEKGRVEDFVKKYDFKVRTEGTLSTEEGQNGKAFHFSGEEGNYIQCAGANAALDFETNIFVEISFRIERFSDDPRKGVFLAAKPLAFYISLWSNDAVECGLYGVKFDQPGPRFKLNQPLATGKWYNLRFTYAEGCAALYLDRSLVDKRVASGRINISPQQLYVGQTGSRSSSSIPFKGAIESIKIGSLAVCVGPENSPMPQSGSKKTDRLNSWRKAPGLCAHFSFDGSLNADRSDIKSTSGKTPEYIEGRFGKALLASGTGGIEYDLSDRIFKESGAISFWFRQIDWDENNDNPQSLLKLSTADGKEYIDFCRLGGQGRNTGSSKLAFNVQAGTSSYPIRFESENWNNEGWHYLFFCWESESKRLQVWVDGVFHTLAETAEVPTHELVKLIIGGGGKEPLRKFALDELAIYKYALNKKEIFKLSHGLIAKYEPPLPYPPQNEWAGVSPNFIEYYGRPIVVYGYDRLGQKLHVSANYSDLDTEKHPVIFTVQDYRGYDLVAPKAVKQPSSFGWLHEVLDISKVPLGTYMVVAKYGDTGMQTRARWDKDSGQTWADAAKLGVEDVLLKPFTPVKAENRVLAAWGRKYKIGAGAELFSSIETQGKELLSSPWKIKIESDGKSLEIKEDSLNYGPAPETHAEVKKSCSIINGGATAGKMDITYRIEQDGVVAVDLELISEDTLKLDCLRMESSIPHKYFQNLAYANFFYGKPAENLDFAGNPFSDGKTKHAVPFVPFFTANGEGMGLNFICASAENWDVSGENEKAAYTWTLDGDNVDVRINILKNDNPSSTKTLDYKFGFLALPFRPLAKNHRSWRMGNFSDNPFLRNYDRPFPEEVNLANYHWFGAIWDSLLVQEKGRLKKIVELAHADKIIVGGHHTPIGRTNFLPENREQHEEWLKIRPEGRKEYGMMFVAGMYQALTRQDIIYPMNSVIYGSLPNMPQVRWGHTSFMSCLGSKSMIDCVSWEMYKLAVEEKLDMFFMDVPDVYPCSNEKHGCGYIGQDGKRHFTWPFWEHRELCRRIRTIFQKYGNREECLNIHCGILLPFYYTYADMIMSGEQFAFLFRGKPLSTSYMDVMPPEYARANLSSAWTGVPTIAVISLGMPPRFEHTDEIMMLCLLHDTSIAQAPPIPEDYLRQVWRIQRDFGLYGDEEFFPYYESGRNIVVQGPRQILCSAYVKNKKALLVIGNVEKNDYDGTLKLDLAKMGFKDKKVTAREVLKNAPLTFDPGAGTLKLNLPGRKLHLVLIEEM